MKFIEHNGVKVFFFKSGRGSANVAEGNALLKATGCYNGNSPLSNMDIEFDVVDIGEGRRTKRQFAKVCEIKSYVKDHTKNRQKRDVILKEINEMEKKMRLANTPPAEEDMELSQPIFAQSYIKNTAFATTNWLNEFCTYQEKFINALTKAIKIFNEEMES